MEVILLEDFEGLGASGEIVKVKPGYARNFLFPRGIALRSSKKNRAISEERKRNKEIKSKRIDKANQSLANKINKTELTFEMQVGDEEKMFGAVTSKDIYSALDEKGVSLDKNAILLDEPIKALGIYHIPIKLDSDLETELKIYIIKT